MNEWTDQDLKEVITIVETALQDGAVECLNVASLFSLSGSGHSVTRGLLWAQRMLDRPVCQMWQSMVTTGVSAAAQEVGPLWVDHHSGHDWEEWLPPLGCPEYPAALCVLQDAAFLGLPVPLQIGGGGSGWVLRVPRLSCAPTPTPLARLALAEQDRRRRP